MRLDDNRTWAAVAARREGDGHDDRALGPVDAHNVLLLQAYTRGDLRQDIARKAQRGDRRLVDVALRAKRGDAPDVDWLGERDAGGRADKQAN